MRSHAEVLGIRRYVQVHTRPSPVGDAVSASRGGVEGYDGVAELWFDSAEAITASVSTPEGMSAGAELLEDERRFIDLDHSPLWLAEEVEVVAL